MNKQLKLFCIENQLDYADIINRIKQAIDADKNEIDETHWKFHKCIEYVLEELEHVSLVNNPYFKLSDVEVDNIKITDEEWLDYSTEFAEFLGDGVFAATKDELLEQTKDWTYVNNIDCVFRDLKKAFNDAQTRERNIIRPSLLER